MQTESSHPEWHSVLPFYVAGTLPGPACAALEDHLTGCARCQAELQEWQIVAAAVRREATARVVLLPPLVLAPRAPRLSTRAAMRAARQLIEAQWPLLGGLLPAVLLVLVLAILGTFGLRDDPRRAVPLLALAPLVAALSVAFLHHTELDPAWEIVAATPTRPGVLLFARITLMLSVIVAVMLGGSITLSVVTGAQLGPLVAVWLGPLLLLAALATILALRWSPTAAAAVSLALWVSMIALLVKELAGAPLITLSLRPLIEPGWLLVGCQLTSACLLWQLGWRLAQRMADWHSPEGYADA